MTSKDSLTFLKKRVGLILVSLWIVFAALYYFVPKLSKGNDNKADSLAKSFTYTYVDLICEKSAKNISYNVKNWKYEKKRYYITVKIECVGCINVPSNDSNECKAVMTYSFTLNQNDKLVNFRRIDGNGCALELEANEAAQNSLKDITKFRSKMKDYTLKH